MVWGQHQADEFNYKGKNEELFQYNTKVSVPFIVSNKNYGVLLDSYSLCRFGNPNDYSQLGEVFKLYDKDGKEGAITGTYVPAEGSGAETLVRREDSLYFEHLVRGDLGHVVNLPKDFPFYGSKVTYEGSIEPRRKAENSSLFCIMRDIQRYTSITSWWCLNVGVRRGIRTAISSRSIWKPESVCRSKWNGFPTEPYLIPDFVYTVR